MNWGLGIGDWGLGIGDWAQSPIPNPQSPYYINIINFIIYLLSKYLKKINNFKYKIYNPKKIYFIVLFFIFTY